MTRFVVVVGAGPAGATFPGKPGNIAYDGSGGQDDEIYTINVGGGGRLNVTDNATDDHMPSYSPSGQKIAYRGSDGNDTEIYTINVDGGGKFNVTDNSTDDYEPSWGSK